MSISNIFSSLPLELPEEVFDTLLQSGPLRIERIVSRGHSTPPSEWYDQPQNEWIMLLQGSASLQFGDGSTRQLQCGDILDIPAHTRHRVDWTDPSTDTIWLALHYPPLSPAGSDGP